MENKEQFTVLMRALAANAGVELSKDILMVYFDTLKDLSDNEFHEAVTKVLNTWEFTRLPPIAVIRKAIQGDPVKQIEDRAEIQATLVISRIGSDYDSIFEDPITQHLMTTRWPFRNWGTQVLESELKWWVKEFKEAYNAYSGTESPIQIEMTNPEVRKLVEDIGK